MRKFLCMAGILIGVLIFGTEVYAQTTVNLDNAVNNAVKEFSNNLKKGSNIAILTMRCDSARMSNYIIEELISVIVNQRNFTVVDRAQLDLIQKEMNFQMSGEVSDSSMQAIGKKIGAQAIVTGTFEPVGNYYRFRVRVIEVESAAILISYSANVQNDHVVASLMGSSRAIPVTPVTPIARTTPVTPAAPVTSTASSDYQNFTIGQRWGTWALNVFLPGIGSYLIMKDIAGGTIQLVVGVGASAFIISGLVITPSGDKSDANYDHDAWNVGYGLGITGFLVAAANGIFNIARTVTYDKPHSRIGSIADPDAWSIAVLPGANGVEQVHLAYTLRF